MKIVKVNQRNSTENLNNIEAKIKEILSDKLNFPIDKINLNSSLVDDLGLDSFGSIEIMFEIENRFNIDILQDDLSKVKVVNDLVEQVMAQSIKTKLND